LTLWVIPAGTVIVSVIVPADGCQAQSRSVAAVTVVIEAATKLVSETESMLVVGVTSSAVVSFRPKTGIIAPLPREDPPSKVKVVLPV
jgi:hypothetical protein